MMAIFLPLRCVDVSVFFVKASWHLFPWKNSSGLNCVAAASAGAAPAVAGEVFGFERHGDRARSGYVDFAVAAHDFDEFVELFGLAGGFDGEAFGGGIDHAGVEDFRFLKYGGPASCAQRTRTRTISRITAGDSVMSAACSTLTSLLICLMTWVRMRSSTSTTMVMRESSGSSVFATVRLSML